jgi:YVTN family beta-propeller protein
MSTESLASEQQVSAVVITPDGKLTYTTYRVNPDSHTVSVIDADNRVIRYINVGRCPSAVAITPNGKKVFVINKDSHTVTVIAIDNCLVIATIKVGKRPWGVAVTRDGTKVCVAGLSMIDDIPIISVIDVENYLVIYTIPVGSCGYSPQWHKGMCSRFGH